MRFTVHNLFHTLSPPAGVAFPLALRGMHLFALLADGHRKCSFRIEFVIWDRPEEERSLWTSDPVIIDLGDDPLTVHPCDFRLTVRFPEPGFYEFRLLCEGVVIAREPLRLLEVP
jgi:hypothetical protein